MKGFTEGKMRALGWAYGYACIEADKGMDIRKVDVGDFISAAKRDLLENEGGD